MSDSRFLPFASSEKSGKSPGRYLSTCFLLAFLLFTGGLFAQETGGTEMSETPTGQVRTSFSKVCYSSTVDPGFNSRGSAIENLAYSPDGHFLAVVGLAGQNETDVFIWDLAKNRLQCHIDGLNDLYYFEPSSFQWSPDGKAVSFGVGKGDKFPIRFWDPMTGKLLKQAPVLSAAGHLSADGNQFLVQLDTAFLSSKFRIYDVSSWNFKEYSEGRFLISSLAWVEKGQVLAVGWWDFKGADGKVAPDPTLDFRGKKIFRTDTVALLIDPSGKVDTKLYLLAHAGGIKNREITKDLEGIKVAIGLGNVLDVPTMTLTQYASIQDIVNGVVPAGAARSINRAMSADGRYLFLKGDPKDSSFPGGMDDESAKNMVIDVATAKPLLSFDGGYQGIAVNPDGKQMAVGYGKTVKLFDLQ